MSVKRAQREVDSEEFGWWMAYSLVEPFGPRRDDERAGVVAAVMRNAWRAKGEEPVDWHAFFPPARPPGGVAAPAAPTDEQLTAKLLAWAAMMNQAAGETQ